MVALLDVNVLIALAWPTHVHHRGALSWFKASQSHGWATCPTTQVGFVRVSSNKKALPDARSPREALSLLRRITALDHHVFWEDDVAMAESVYVAPRKLLGFRQVTDAHLLAVALRHEGRLATLDKGLMSLVPDGFEATEAVCLISG